MNEEVIAFCPLCNDNATVEKVSSIVEKALTISTTGRNKAISWAGKTYYVYEKMASAPSPFMAFVFNRALPASLRNLPSK